MRLPLALLAAALLVACTPQPPQAGAPTAASEPAPLATAVAGGAYPGPNSAYPGPNSAYPGSVPIPTPQVSMDPVVVPQPASAAVGVAHGTIYRLTKEGQREPLPGAMLYLGTIITAQGVEAMVQMDRGSSPRAVTNGLGQFVFTDVPPGRYGLMLDAIQGTVLLNDPATGGDFIIEIAGGQVNDLGALAYELPPDLY